MKHYLIDYSGNRVLVLSRSSRNSAWEVEATFSSGEAAEAYIESKTTITIQYRCEVA